MYVQHVAIEGLATAGGIQGTVADACLQILEYHGIKPVVKWVDDFVLFREPLPKLTPNSTTFFPYNLADILSMTRPLGIPWHDVSKKGQDFTSSFDYVGFTWDIKQRTVHVPSEKQIHAINKIQYALSSPTLTCHDTASTHGTSSTSPSSTVTAGKPLQTFPTSSQNFPMGSSNIIFPFPPEMTSFGGEPSSLSLNLPAPSSPFTHLTQTSG